MRISPCSKIPNVEVLFNWYLFKLHTAQYKLHTQKNFSTYKPKPSYHPGYPRQISTISSQL